MNTKKIVASVVLGLSLFVLVTNIVGLISTWYTFVGNNIHINNIGLMYSKKYYKYFKALLLAATLLSAVWATLFVLFLKTKKTVFFIIGIVIVALIIVTAFLTRLNMRVNGDSDYAGGEGNPYIYDYQLFVSTFSNLIQLAVTMILALLTPLYLKKLNQPTEACDAATSIQG